MLETRHDGTLTFTPSIKTPILPERTATCLGRCAGTSGHVQGAGELSRATIVRLAQLLVAEEACAR